MWLILVLSNVLLSAAFDKTSVPSYFIDEEVSRIFQSRINNCLGSNTPVTELNNLRESSVSHYQASQELIAYTYFMDPHNAHRRHCSEGAELEYIPFLPLSWKVGFSTQTVCTSGGECPRTPLTHPYCDIKYLVEDTLRYVKYVKGNPTKNAIPFIVTGAFNVKTVLGFGMPKQIRRGSAWNSIMWFVESVSIGHYERLPQCADLLRRPWKFIAEIPYVPLIIPNSVHVDDASTTKKDFDFVFAGRIRLWAIARACAVRPWLFRQLVGRSRTVLIEIPENTTHGPPVADRRLYDSMQHSRFCLVTFSNSYSTAFFYNAIQADCLPVVISDWFVFSFWWAIPYEKFVIRIPEEIFLSNPNQALDYILQRYTDKDVEGMLREMAKWKRFLDYRVSDTGEILPLNLMLIEIKEASNELKSLVVKEKKNDKFKRNESGKILTCFDPIFCATRSDTNTTHTFRDFRTSNVLPYLCQHSPRLLGRYKIVYNQKCVKLLWPLRPGNVLKKDMNKRHGGAITRSEVDFIKVFHNLSGAALSMKWDVYPDIPREGSNIYVVG